MHRRPPEILARMKELVDPELQSHVDTLHPALRDVARYHFGWDDDAGSGKAVRPALTILGARAVGATGDEPEVLDAACAVEFIHNFSLLHDDIMDGDRTRRHRPTAWTVFGTDQTLLTGCALQTLAFSVLAHRSAASGLETLAGSVQVLIAGQCDDLALACAPHATVEQCLAMEAGKTASLLAASASLGAVVCGADPAQTEALAAYGHHLGMAFQLVDDLLGIWGDTASTGKPVAADLRARKRSAPVVAALCSATREGEQLGALLAGCGALTEEDVVLAAKLVDESGGRAWTQQQADWHTEQALARLDRLTPGSDTSGDLTEVTRFLLLREW